MSFNLYSSSLVPRLSPLATTFGHRCAGGEPGNEANTYTALALFPGSPPLRRLSVIIAQEESLGTRLIPIQL